MEIKDHRNHIYKLKLFFKHSVSIINNKFILLYENFSFMNYQSHLLYIFFRLNRKIGVLNIVAKEQMNNNFTLIKYEMKRMHNRKRKLNVSLARWHVASF